MNYVAFSGGKDSTALALRLHELGEDFTLLFTPTGNELPDLRAHIDRIVALTEKPLVEPPNRSLAFWIEEFKALPNHRQRWCTRLIKIEPCIRHLEAHPGSTLSVGLRADEGEREGLYGDYATYRYPLREWGWDLPAVRLYLKGRGIEVPKRTDCAFCYGQRIVEWRNLWRDYPALYAEAERIEAETGRTFRSPNRDTWPAPLAALRAEFERGRPIRGERREEADMPCRVCRL